MIATGTGSPIAVIPGIQGRWEWMRPAIDALAARHRVVSWSLSELRPGREPDGGFLSWVDAIDAALDRAQERAVSLIGVSFGGLIAACYAAQRPERVSSLVLVSTPAPVWRPRPGDAFCLKFPRLALPYFGVRALQRMGPELYLARDTWPQRARLGVEYAMRGVRAPVAPARMARWVCEWQAIDITSDCRRITAPTLLITGDAPLDQVVPVERTLEYMGLIPGATHVTLSGTGHLGLITKPRQFADLAGRFIDTARPGDRRVPPAEERNRHAS